MKRILFCIFCFTFIGSMAFTQPSVNIIEKEDFLFLEGMTKAVLDSSRIYPGQPIPSFGSNNTGGILIRPGGKSAYPSFWIRDYAMTLESGLISIGEQKHMLLLTASTQCDQTRITKGGSMIPFGAIADHIRIDNSLPIYFPGTYSYEEQGNKVYGMLPPYCDQFYFIQMAYCYLKSTSDAKLLLKEVNGTKLIDRLEIAFKVPPSRPGSHIVFTSDEYRGVDFGFRDAIEITGDLCFSSILKFRAANQLAGIFERMQNKAKAETYRGIAKEIRLALPKIFLDKKGMLRASTGKSSQPDVWSTALAVYYEMLEGSDLANACRVLADAYAKGTLAFKGNIRHVLTGDDFNDKTAWEISLANKNEYQNGAYWGVPTGWVCYAISKVNRVYAKQLAKEFFTDLRENDFRKGGDFGAPFECFHPPDHQQNPLYLATVMCPYIVFKSAF